MSIVQVMAKATRAVIHAIAAANAENSTKQSTGPKEEGPLMNQPTFNCDTDNKYNELKNFSLEVNNVFKLYNTPDIKKIAVKKWLGKKDYSC